MAHFSVFVAVQAESADEAVGAVEEALDPFSEHFEVAPYEEEIVPIEVERALAYADEQRTEAGEPVVNRDEPEAVLAAVAAFECREVFRREDGSGFFYTSTFNPDGHWDWWVVGGRWAGAFALASGERVDVARAVDVDLAGMRQAAQRAAEEAYDAFAADTAGLVPGPRWSSVYAMHGPAGRDQARAEWAADPWVNAATKAQGVMWGDPHDVWGVGAEDPREVFVSRQVEEVAVPYAWLQEGQWDQSGYHGFFGPQTDAEVNETVKWCRLVAEGWEALQQPQEDGSGEWWVVNVDCHT